ncbi:MAG: GntR family transcriptional regulator [Actinomycetales bacterium]|jgi:DNA-binding GntR family transcriptional regulator|nr:GntR family transcriptional regulator [Leifsonia sp.]
MPLPVKDTQPVERQLLRDVVYNRLYDGIIDGTLEPGETLLDEKLTAWLGVSRTPVREALMRLADIGLVEMAPNRYTRVAPIDLRAIDEAISTSGILHEHAAKTGVPAITAPAVTRLEKLAKDAKKYTKSADLPALGSALNAFFREFEAAADNPVLLAVSEGLSPQLLRYVTVWQQPFGSPDIPGQLAAIAAAAKERDGEKAAALIHDLYEPARQQFLKEFRRSDAEIDAGPVI